MRWVPCAAITKAYCFVAEVGSRVCAPAHFAAPVASAQGEKFTLLAGRQHIRVGVFQVLRIAARSSKVHTHDGLVYTRKKNLKNQS